MGHDGSTVEILGHYDTGLETGISASQGVVGSSLLRNRAMARPAEALEYIPGMVVTQHSGEGKANQYFLRGMNLDHGTDLSITVNGVPVNMPTHAHGQGYSDLNFLIPELVRRVDYRKGPYHAAEGDFASAGSAHFIYRTRLERPIYDLSVAQRGYRRGLAAQSLEVAPGVNWLMAMERMNNDGPWTVPQGLRKTNAQFILSGGSPAQGWSTSLSLYSAHWRSTDQIPQRLIDAGSHLGQPFGRFDSLDPDAGASTTRNSISGAWHRSDAGGLTRFEWFALRYDLRLVSNFTYALDRVSDQFGQTDARTVLGGRASRTWFSDEDAEPRHQHTIGLQWRQDRMRLGLQDTLQRQVQAVIRDDDVRQWVLGLHAQSQTRWHHGVRTVLGLRADQFHARVDSHPQPLNSGSAGALRLSPKFSLVLGPWQKTEFFFNAGSGLRSNDARGVTARVDPRTGSALSPVPVWIGSRGHEWGMRSSVLPALQTSLAIWRLDFDSEWVYAADAASIRVGRPSRRTGIEWTSHWTPSAHLWVDANLAWTWPRHADSDPAGNAIPNAVRQVANLHIALRELGPWSGSLGVRYIGPASLLEDDSVRSAPSLSANLRIQRRIRQGLDLSLDVLNLLDRRNNDISYHYTSRLPGEPPAGVPDVHVHPAEPRTLRLSARLSY